MHDTNTEQISDDSSKLRARCKRSICPFNTDPNSPQRSGWQQLQPAVHVVVGIVMVDPSVMWARKTAQWGETNVRRCDFVGSSSADPRPPRRANAVVLWW